MTLEDAVMEYLRQDLVGSKNVFQVSDKLGVDPKEIKRALNALIETKQVRTAPGYISSVEGARYWIPLPKIEEPKLAPPQSTTLIS